MDIEELAEQNAQLAEVIGMLDERLARLEDSGGPRSGAAGEGPGDVDLDPETLPEWVAWLTATYRLGSRLPVDWPEQPHLAAELAALRAAWVAAMTSDGITPQRSGAALAWHEALMRGVGRWHDDHATSAHPFDTQPLKDWVGWLLRTYQVTDRIPTCWVDVPGVVEELEALRAAYQAAYTPDRRPRTTSAATLWHDNLVRTLERIHNVWGKQDLDRHLDDPERFMASGADEASKAW